MKVEFQAKAFINAAFMSIENVVNGQRMPVIVADGGCLDGYSQIGTCTVIIDVMPKDKIIASQVDALRKQLHTVRAENQRRENAILDQISKLEALPCEVDA